MKVRLPSALESYAGAAVVDAEGGTIAEVLAHLEARYPGIRFRIVDEQQHIRCHIRFFVSGEQVRDLGRALAAGEELVIVQALSGG